MKRAIKKGERLFYIYKVARTKKDAEKRKIWLQEMKYRVRITKAKVGYNIWTFPEYKP